MTISFKCFKCGKELAVPDSKAGKTGACPKCRTRMKVPTKEESVFFSEAIPVEDGGGANDTRLTRGTGMRTRGPARATGTRSNAPIPELAQGPGAEIDPDATMIDESRQLDPPMAEAIPIPDPVDEDSLPEPEPMDDSDLDIPPLEDDAPSSSRESAATIAARVKAQREGGSAGDARSARRARYAQALEEKNQKKKGGGFLWMFLGLLFAVLHTVAAAVAGVIVFVTYVQTPAEMPWVEPAVEVLKLNETVEQMRAGLPDAPPTGGESTEGGETQVENDPAEDGGVTPLPLPPPRPDRNEGDSSTSPGHDGPGTSEPDPFGGTDPNWDPDNPLANRANRAAAHANNQRNNGED